MPEQNNLLINYVGRAATSQNTTYNTIYFWAYLKCQLQYVGESESESDIRNRNHRKDVTGKDSIPASNHFDIEGHNFNIYAYFLLIEQRNQTVLDKVTVRKL